MIVDLLLDEQDVHLLEQHKWYVNAYGYAVSRDASKKGGILYMHRVIMAAPKGMEVDHINGKKLDNRRANLRLCTRAQNVQNTNGQKRRKCKYKGVYQPRHSKRWVAQIKANKTQYSLGYHDTPELAALAYNEAALKHFGPFARLNEVESV